MPMSCLCIFWTVSTSQPTRNPLPLREVKCLVMHINDPRVPAARVTSYCRPCVGLRCR
jgi:hypothetical protein